MTVRAYHLRDPNRPAAKDIAIQLIMVSSPDPAPPGYLRSQRTGANVTSHTKASPVALSKPSATATVRVLCGAIFQPQSNAEFQTSANPSLMD